MFSVCHALSCSIKDYMVYFPPVCVCGYLWLFSAILGFLDLPLAITYYIQLSLSSLGYLRINQIISDYLRLSPDILAYIRLWLPWVISGHPWLSLTRWCEFLTHKISIFIYIIFCRTLYIPKCRRKIFLI